MGALTLLTALGMASSCLPSLGMSLHGPALQSSWQEQCTFARIRSSSPRLDQSSGPNAPIIYRIDSKPLKSIVGELFGLNVTLDSTWKDYLT